MDRKIYLEYEGTSFSEWHVSGHCSVKDKRSAKTELHCSSPGFHLIKPIVKGSVKEQRYLFVDNSHICFLWYYRVMDNSSSVKLLISDEKRREHISSIYIKGEFFLKSPKSLIFYLERDSKILTKQLATLGQKPTIHTASEREIYYPAEPLENGVWKISVPMEDDDDVLRDIQGNNVPFQDCFIPNLLFLLTFPSETIPEIPGYLPLSSPSGSQLIADWNACIPSYVVVVADMETFQTNDSFHTWTKIRVPPGILNDDERHSVTDVCLSENRVFFVIKGILYLRSFHNFTRLGRNENLPDDGIVGITSRRWCWTNYLFKSGGKRSSVAIWTENEVYLGSNYQPNNTRQHEPHNLFRFNKIITSMELKNLLYLSSGTLTIHVIEYTAHPLELALFLSYCIVCTSNKHIYLAIYNEDTKQWLFKDFTLLVPINSVLVPRFLYSATSELVLWDKHRVYYSYHNFTVSGILQTPTENGNLSRLSQNSSIHSVFLDYFGNIVIKMENNIMFHSKVNIKDAVRLYSWTNKAIKSFFGLNVYGQLYLIYVFGNGTLQTQQYPLILEIQSISFQKNENCPYTSFHTNPFHVFHSLDKRETLTIWAQIIYPGTTSLHIILESYGPKIIQENKLLNYEIVLGYCTKTMIVTFYQTQNYEAADNYFQLQDQNSGVVVYNVRPSKYSKACTASHKVFQVAVGCSPKKYIAVRGFSKTGCLWHNFSYVIEKSYLRHQPSQNLKVKYDWESYGCPVRLAFKRHFQPVLQLFGENGYIEDVAVNFIVWEIHGRNDYSFNTTMHKSGCLHEAQTWKSMTELNKHLPLEQAWGPENYKHCFSYAIGKPGDLNQPYEIINQTNSNHIIWPMDHSGMYVFGVKILDPNYR
ncbi:cation channel sperm-associated protein subunit epsilon [Orycteropus afer afer]|uniref:Cation channel sperm-associated protein subunit epsilon n=1 Tax=Orycteropus afer afer TaxID=1230840 RepID=A0A8B7AIL8_ORYAF|nr:cation channel sperm-associated protein subunit epsilon [Orycteropus afer afer]